MSTYRKRLNVFLLWFLAVGIAAPAFALDGNQLYSKCTSQATWELNFCDSYIWGVAEGVTSMDLIYSKNSKGLFQQLICTPKGVVPQQIIDVVKKYLKDNPQNRADAATQSVLIALTKAFPCNKPQ